MMKPVMVIGATNRPDALDSALRRAGRFDREILMGVPDQAARLSILGVLTSRLRLAGDFNLEDLARRTPGYVGMLCSCACRVGVQCSHDLSWCAMLTRSMLVCNAHTIYVGVQC